MTDLLGDTASRFLCFILYGVALVGFVATGGRASGHTKAAHQEGCQCVAFAEVDKTRWDGVLGKEGWSEATGYTDWP